MADRIQDIITASLSRDLTPGEVRELIGEVARLRKLVPEPHPKVDPFHKIVTFRGGKVPPLPGVPRPVIEAGIQMHVERRARLIRAALIEEGADPDHVDAINDPARRAHAETLPPIADDILDRVRRRVAAGEFDEPFTIPLPQEGT